MNPRLRTAPAPRRRVMALLDGHAPADAAEARSLERIRDLTLRTDAPFDRQQTAPGHLTASALVLDPERRRAALILHQKLGLWLQPGGHFEPGETDAFLAAAREAEEEIGVAVRPVPGRRLLLDVDVHTIPTRPGEPEHEHFDVRLLLQATSADAYAGDGALGFKWVTPAEAATLDLDPGLQRALAKVPFVE